MTKIKTYCLTKNRSIAERTGDNEWHIMYGGWSFRILDESTIQVVPSHHTADKINTTFYVFETDNLAEYSTAFDEKEVDRLKADCPELDWQNLSPYERDTDGDQTWDDGISF